MIRCSRQLLRWKETEQPEGSDPICPLLSKVLNPMIPWERRERRGVMVRREARRKDQIIREGGEGVTVGVILQKQLMGGAKKKRRAEEEDYCYCLHRVTNFSSFYWSWNIYSILLLLHTSGKKVTLENLERWAIMVIHWWMQIKQRWSGNKDGPVFFKQKKIKTLIITSESSSWCLCVKGHRNSTSRIYIEVWEVLERFYYSSATS